MADIEWSVCYACAQGFHWECNKEPCCCNNALPVDSPTESPISMPSPTIPVAILEATNKTGLRDGMQWSKPDNQIRDLKSTGRKRAAVLYPLDRNAKCEWTGLRFAGGGLFPIVGCNGNNQDNRHHGPVYLTTANVEGNVHRICSVCHNSFHAANDPYVKYLMTTVMWRPHDPNTLATDQERAESLAIGNAKYAALRFGLRNYNKATDDYNEFLEQLKQRGAEITNEWLGI